MEVFGNWLEVQSFASTAIHHFILDSSKVVGMNRNGKLIVPKRSCLVMAILASGSLSANLQADTITGPGVVSTVESGDAVESWVVSDGATLNVASGAATEQIVASGGAQINLTGATVTGAPSSSREINGLDLQNASATISDSTVTSSNSFALVLANVSTASVSGSEISGVGRGVSVAAGSDIVLSNSNVYGSDAGGTGFLDGGHGVALFGGRATIENGSVVTGDKTGLLLSADSGSTPEAFTPSAIVDGSTIIGNTGSAILVGSYNDARPSEAVVTIQNGSTLVGGNGIILEVANNSSATFNIINNALDGDVLVADGAAATVFLDSSSSLSGNVTNVASFDLNNNSSYTGNLTGTTDLTVRNHSSVSGNISDVENISLFANSTLSGNLSGVENLSLDNSTWTTDDGLGVSNLAMNAGTVELGSGVGAFGTLSLDSLSGNGLFVMDTDLAAHASDLINVAGVASGSYKLLVRNTGSEPLVGDQDQQLVHTGNGSTAEFGVVGDQVDLGTFTYTLQQKGTDWFLVQNGEITTPSTKAAIGIFSAAPTVWYGELSSLRSRMGELRYGKAQGGAWMRSYGNKYNLSAAGGTAYQQTQQGVSFGADGMLPTSSGNVLLGVMGGYSKSDLDIIAGTTGSVKSTYVGVYGTWLSDEGYYIDAIIKANQFKNNADVRMSDGEKSKGNYKNYGLGASVEAGKHIKLKDNWFVEPFVQASSLWVNGEGYHLDNGLNAKSNKADSFLGKVGTSVGKNFPLHSGGFVQPYVKVAVAREFANSNNVKINTTRFSNDLSGNRGEIGAGLVAQLSDVLQVHGDVEYSNGENIEMPWGVNLGLRYNW